MSENLRKLAKDLAMGIYPYDSEHRDRITKGLLSFGEAVLERAKVEVKTLCGVNPGTIRPCYDHQDKTSVMCPVCERITRLDALREELRGEEKKA